MYRDLVKPSLEGAPSPVISQGTESPYEYILQKILLVVLPVCVPSDDSRYPRPEQRNKAAERFNISSLCRID